MNKPFSIKQIRDTPFDDSPDAVTITTTDDYIVEVKDGDGGAVRDGKFHEFYATWSVVVGKLKHAELREDLTNGKVVGPLKLVSKPSQKRQGKNYYDLVPA